MKYSIEKSWIMLILTFITSKEENVTVEIFSVIISTTTCIFTQHYDHHSSYTTLHCNTIYTKLCILLFELYISSGNGLPSQQEQLFLLYSLIAHRPLLHQ